MTIIPCEVNANLRREVEAFAEALKTEAHALGAHGLSERDFYQGGLFRGAIERIRGQFSATMREKREFVRHILNFMQDGCFIRDWVSSGDANRHDYTITLPTGKIAVVELKGCLDGNNTTIYERPPHAQEFILWSVCSNPSADPRHNAWSGIHTRLSAEIIENPQKRVDGLVIWDWLCGTIGRPCPKLGGREDRLTTVGPYGVTPPCIYLFPGTTPAVRNNPSPPPQQIAEIGVLQAFHTCFKGLDSELNFVRFTVDYRGVNVVRKTTVERDGVVQRESGDTPIQRR
jgi:hypothetical protein